MTAVKNGKSAWSALGPAGRLALRRRLRECVSAVAKATAFLAFVEWLFGALGASLGFLASSFVMLLSIVCGATVAIHIATWRDPA